MYQNCRQLWLVLGVKLMEINSNLFSRYSCTSCTLQGTNISDLGKRKIIFKMPFLGEMLVPWRVYHEPKETFRADYCIFFFQYHVHFAVNHQIIQIISTVLALLMDTVARVVQHLNLLNLISRTLSINSLFVRFCWLLMTICLTQPTRVL